MGDFIANFETSMTNLNTINSRIVATLQSKRDFSNMLTQKLQEIRDKIRGLSGQIGALKTTIQNLEAQINANTGSVADKDREIAQLNQRREQLEAEVAEKQRELDETTNKTQTDIQQKQAQIDNLEDRLRQSEQLVTTREAEIEALRKELADRGDDAQHAAEIQQLLQEAQERLAAAEKDAEERATTLRGQIAALETQINEQQQTLEAKERELEDLRQNQGQAQQALTEQIQTLTQEKAALTAQNEDLTQRLIAATQAIIQATDNLNQLTESFPNNESNAEFGRIFQEIEESIQEISNVIQGHGANIVPANPSPVPHQNLPQDTPIRLSDGRELELNKIISELTKKSNQRGSTNTFGVNKYKDALNEIHNANDANQISAILNNFNFNAAGAVTGGKKTKKNKKQRGGFTYKDKSKRKSLRSTNKHSFRRTSKTSSRRSSKSGF